MEFDNVELDVAGNKKAVVMTVVYRDPFLETKNGMFLTSHFLTLLIQ